ncbi:MAG: MBL fold metallo-hydrolase [Patescibacteria group bacterium]
MNSIKAFKNRWREYLIALLLLGNVFVYIAFWQKRPSDILSVYFLDVGQGDAMFVDTPSHRQLILDGGRNKKVLTELGKIMPFGDKNIDIMIESHPDADHIGGLLEVASRYDVGVFLEPGVESGNKVDDELKRRISEKKIRSILARRGMVINFGDGVKLTILSPDRDVSRLSTNNASIVAKLEYGENSLLLTGDSTKKVENILLGLDKYILNSDVLKAGHHGSRTSTATAFAAAVSPEYAVISAGKDNSYGHPHKEVLNILTKVGAKVVSTAELGTIKFETDGKILQLK